MTSTNIHLSTLNGGEQTLESLVDGYSLEWRRESGWGLYLQTEPTPGTYARHRIATQFGVGEERLWVRCGNTWWTTNPDDEATETDEDTARTLAEAAHREQRDRANRPYIHHVQCVAESGKTTDERTVGWLHDVVEDGGLSEDVLRDTFTPTIMDAVMALTRRDGENYLAEYMPRVLENPLARQVKLYDLTDNMDLRRIFRPTRRDIERWLKYDTAKTMILQYKTGDGMLDPPAV